MHDPLFSDVDLGPLPEPPACPFCDGRDTEVISEFGAQLSVAQCWCRRCRTGFEYVKWEDGRADELPHRTG